MNTLHRRRSYIRVYVPVSRDHADVLREADGRAMAFTDYERAISVAATKGFIVVNLYWFRTHTLKSLIVKPTAIRIYACIHNVERTFHAELDASVEEFLTLNETMPRDSARQPKAMREKLAAARVREEE